MKTQIITLLLLSSLAATAQVGSPAPGSTPAQPAPSRPRPVVPPGLNKMPGQNNQNNNQNGSQNNNGQNGQNNNQNNNQGIQPNTGAPTVVTNYQQQPNYQGTHTPPYYTNNAGQRFNQYGRPVATNFNNPMMTNRPPYFTNHPPQFTNRPPFFTNRPPVFTNRPPVFTNQSR